MLTGLILIMLALIGAMIFRQWKELAVRRIELQRQLAKREQLMEQFQGEITDTSGKLEEIRRWLDDANGEIEELKAETAELEAALARVREKPRTQLIVLDRQTMLAQTFWEVKVSNPDFAETVTARLAPPDYTRAWVEGRTFLVGADTPEEATARCAGRFASTLGYRVAPAVAYRRSMG
ncbi:MAG TPA: hypothetical protein VEB20_03020 [Azospirillaceae bacterium]|nr:hypothetical protein [Azospirillaceae bacterium]